MSNKAIVVSLWVAYILLVTSSLMILQSVYPSVLLSQAVFVLLGGLILLLLMRIDYRLILISPWLWYGISVVILVITMILGVTTRGSVRWIQLLGVNIQTSELVKPLLLLFGASYLSVQERISLKGLLMSGVVLMVPVVLVFLQPDLGTTILLAWMFLAIYVAGGMKLQYLGLVVFLAVLLVPLSSYGLKPYQQERLTSFINPDTDPLGAGYHSLQAMIAVGSGQIIGKGLGQGSQSQLRFLPERHTDFIFSSFVEELGFVGGLVLLSTYGLMFWGLIQTARRAPDDTGSIIALGTLSVIVMQVFVNVGMNIGLLPITGLTLPFMSAGGSSLLSLAIMLGLSLSVATRGVKHSTTVMVR